MRIRQLQLGLFPGEPWDGRSPRVLTRARLGVIFKAQAEKDDRFVADPDQTDLWPAAIVAPWFYQGAPLLEEV